MLETTHRTSSDQAARRALPPPRHGGDVALEEALGRRRSQRNFDATALDDAQIGQLCWAAQGVTSSDGKRTAPSAGGAYPIELYVATPAGLLHYLPDEHAVDVVTREDLRDDLYKAGLGQSAIASASAVFVISVVPARSQAQFGSRSERYVLLEAGHVAQNILLQATAMGLGAVPMGNVDDASIYHVAQLAWHHLPVYVIAVGHAM